MPYNFSIKPGQPAEFKLLVRANADSYTLTAEFTKNRIALTDWYDNAEAVVLSVPVVSNGNELTISLTTQQVDLIGKSYYRIKAVKDTRTLYIESGKIDVFRRPPVVEVVGEDLYVVDPAGGRVLAGSVIGPKGEIGETGLKGDKGDKGDKGEIVAVEVVGLPAGATPTVVNDGTTTEAEFTFGIPKGDKGDKGEAGDLTPTTAWNTAQGTYTVTGTTLPYTFRWTLVGNLAVAISASNPPSTVSGTCTFVIKQAATGGPFTVTWPASLEWAGDAPAPAMPTVASAEMIVHLLWTGAAWRAFYGGAFFP